MTHSLRPVSLSTDPDRQNRLRSSRRLLQLACVGIALVAPAVLVPDLASCASAQPAQAQNAQAQNAQTQPAQAPQQLLTQVENFYHFAAVGNYEAAAAIGRQLLQGNYNPEQVLDAFREVHERRTAVGYSLDQRLLQWRNTPQISEVTTQIVELINQGRVARATDPAFIAEQVERLNQGTRAYRNALTQLNNSGEYAVPVMIQYLSNPEQAQFHADIRRALRDLGVDVLNPLLAATQMENEQVLASLLLVLGDLGYDAAVPYLLEQLETSESQLVRNAAQQALQRLGYSGGSNAAAEYYELARSLYYNESAIRPSARLGTATIWQWGGPQVGLIRTDVPQQIFDEVMAMRTAGKALQLGQGQDAALALWLASNYRREGELRQGENDPTRPENAPSAGYYGTQAGTRYLQMVLDRAQRDRVLVGQRRYNTADVALRTIKSLQEIVGRSNIDQGETPLTRAMTYPDRRVRIEAAMALAQALPTQGFSGQEQVVPLLADALSQTGEPTVLLAMENRDELNSLTEALDGQGYEVVGATSTTEAIEQAQALAGVDVVVADANLGEANINQLLANAENNPKLSGAAKLILTQTSQSRYEAMKDTNPTLATTTARSGEGLNQAIESARQSVGSLPLSPEAATELATRAGNLLKEIGIGNSVFDIDAGAEFVLAGLDDRRPEIQMLVGEVAALLDNDESQQALLEQALAQDTSPEVKVSLLNSLATSAKRYGNRLGGDAVNQLLAAAANRENLEVQAAAAEAVGALNLPADQARQLIVEETVAGESARQ